MWSNVLHCLPPWLGFAELRESGIASAVEDVSSGLFVLSGRSLGAYGIPVCGGAVDKTRNNTQLRERFMRRIQVASAMSDRFLESRICSDAETFAPSLNVPPHFLQMLLVVEDKRFGSHCGIDPVSIARALICNMFKYGDLQGASTITQQLYDILMSQEDPTYFRPRRYSRKIKQSCWSLKKEIKDTKIEILREYLSSVYWGRAYYGIDAACQGYFKRRKSSVSVAESFFLAERLANPNRAYVSRIESLLARPGVRGLMQAGSCSREEVRRIYDAHLYWRG